jgi:2-C-methyl-D-erythritol 2,4-cyclodiphosphate synthase
MSDFRIGYGYDVHKLVESIPLVICEIPVNSPKGSLGHSDGDVGLHVICDAILGALALGDLGTYFPSSDLKWKGADSRSFLDHVLRLMDCEGYSINNIDCTIILQSPHINKYIPKMRQNIADACHVNINQISVKATTTDKLGSIGREEGIAASAIVLLKKDSHEH